MHSFRIGDVEISPPTTNCSGEDAVTPDRIGYMARHFLIGCITGKSIGEEARLGNQPNIVAQIGESSLQNAVGLSGPAITDFVRELSEYMDDGWLARRIPFCMSIHSDSAEGFRRVAKIAEPFCRIIELNLSCGHAGHGGKTLSQFGQSPEESAKIVGAVKDAVSRPVQAKLTPTAPDIGAVAAAIVEAGADGIVAINILPAPVETYNGIPMLSNPMGMGGISGESVRELGIKCVREIHAATRRKVPITAAGGIDGVAAMRRYRDAGASGFAIGTAMFGRNDLTKQYFYSQVMADLEKGTNLAECVVLNEWVARPFECEVTEVMKISDDIKIIYFDRKVDAQAGQFVMFQLNGDDGEKPVAGPFRSRTTTRSRCLSRKSGSSRPAWLNWSRGTRRSRPACTASHSPSTRISVG